MEEIYQDRDRFAQLVREVASPDVGKMGIEILSFTIKDVYDRYLRKQLWQSSLSWVTSDHEGFTKCLYITKAIFNEFLMNVMIEELLD